MSPEAQACTRILDRIQFNGKEEEPTSNL